MSRTLELINRHPTGNILSVELMRPGTQKSPGSLKRRTAPAGIRIDRISKGSDGKQKVGFVDVCKALECSFDEALAAVENSPQAQDLLRRGWMKMVVKGADPAAAEKAKKAAEQKEPEKVTAAKEADKRKAEEVEEAKKAEEQAKKVAAEAEKATKAAAAEKAKKAAEAGPKPRGKAQPPKKDEPKKAAAPKKDEPAPEPPKVETKSEKPADTPKKDEPKKDEPAPAPKTTSKKKGTSKK